MGNGLVEVEEKPGGSTSEALDCSSLLFAASFMLRVNYYHRERDGE
jgi:hypothetical protein